MSTHREELAAQQQRLIDALLDIAPPPREVDAEQIRFCAEALKNKRARVLHKLSGGCLAECCGPQTDEMEAYFRRYPGVHPDGGYADLQRFKRFLAVRRLKAFLGLV